MNVRDPSKKASHLNKVVRGFRVGIKKEILLREKDFHNFNFSV